MKKILSTLFLVTILSSVSAAQNFNLTGSGARAEGFGGAFIGLADDATAVVWNPAGLAQLERAEASIVTRYISESTEYTNSADASLNDKSSQGHFSFNFGSFAIPLSTGETKIVAAIAYQRQLDFYTSVKQRNEFTFQGNDYVQLLGEESRGGVNTITPAISAKLSSVISVGISANIWTGSSTVKDYNEIENVARDDRRFERDYSGFNFMLGGLVDFEGADNGFPLKLGAILRTPFTLTAEGKNIFDGNFLLSGPDNYDVKTDVQMPLMFGFGTSYRIGENLTVAADYEIRNYGSRKLKNTFRGVPSTIEPNLSESKKGLNEFRIGAEYLIVLDNGVIPLRAGFKTVPTLMADYVLEDPGPPEVYGPGSNQVSGTGFAVGSGFIGDVFALDITYSVTSFTQKSADGPSENNYSTGTLGSSVIIYF